MGAALGFSSQGGGRFPRFISGKTIAPFIGLQLREKLENPLVFQGPAVVSGFPTRPASLLMPGFSLDGVNLG